MPQTVIEYVLNRFHDLGVDAVFGVPGDFAFPVQDAIVHHPDIAWIGCCNELNAGYAADGYARIRGAAALSTTYGVGELSAINAIAGAYAENLPISPRCPPPRCSPPGHWCTTRSATGSSTSSAKWPNPWCAPARS